MTYTEAQEAAAVLVQSSGLPVGIWEHTGGRLGNTGHVSAGSGRYLLVKAGEDPPRWGWTRKETVTPSGEIVQ